MRLVVGITGATGSIYGIRLLESETGRSIAQVQGLAHQVYDFTSGMVVLPCSIKTLSGIATSYNNTLVIRAADDLLARPASELPAKTLNVPVTVIAGVHIGPAGFFQTPKDLIDELIRSIPRLVQAVVAAMGSRETLPDRR